ncbi:hypothetical protein J2W55_005293 [Mucilaginibacter pocheonensis]|uniref:Uncharacterized protein n=1 Tax=Mucilaginibacter pocheonensis TaxID=398050 RepID=A0ABU1TKP8_9SPHI|nr:hypothetical protein [Mucilaginibacter pocheonensis]
MASSFGFPFLCYIDKELSDLGFAELSLIIADLISPIYF